MDKTNLPIEYSDFLDFIPEEFLEGIDEAKDVISGIPFAGSIISFGIRKYIQQREINFLIDVIEERRKISKIELNKKLFLKRAYLTSLVIAKVQTQEKYNRFKTLLINSTLFDIPDDDYELYNNIIDELTDKEFIFLFSISKLKQNGTPQENANEYKDCCDDLVNKKIINKDEKNLLQARLAGKGLIMQAAAFGGLSFKEVSSLAHSLINFIDKGDIINA